MSKTARTMGSKYDFILASTNFLLYFRAKKYFAQKYFALSVFLCAKWFALTVQSVYVEMNFFRKKMLIFAVIYFQVSYLCMFAVPE